MNENVKPIQVKNDNPGKVSKRQRSTIGFPYADYDSSLGIATAIYSYAGHGECSPEQLAAWTNQSVKSSTFRIQLASAKLFGIIESGAETGELKLTDLGRRTFDSNESRTAKAQAFLCVPLFSAIHEIYKDGVTPPSAALEREIISLGVAEKQKAKARQVFENSAQQTGFRDVAPNRLVLPATIVKPEEERENKDTGGSKDGCDLDLDPLIMALLRKIPKKDWTAENRLRWFRTFAMNVSQVFDDDSNLVELKIELIPQPVKEK